MCVGGGGGAWGAALYVYVVHIIVCWGFWGFALYIYIYIYIYIYNIHVYKFFTDTFRGGDRIFGELPCMYTYMYVKLFTNISRRETGCVCNRVFVLLLLFVVVLIIIITRMGSCARAPSSEDLSPFLDGGGWGGWGGGGGVRVGEGGDASCYEGSLSWLKTAHTYLQCSA